MHAHALHGHAANAEAFQAHIVQVHAAVYTDVVQARAVNVTRKVSTRQTNLVIIEEKKTEKKTIERCTVKN
jgi:hypothetical protein